MQLASVVAVWAWNVIAALGYRTNEASECCGEDFGPERFPQSFGGNMQ